MALMHPMYNHVGRSRKKKRKKTQSLLVAEKTHKKWLQSMGLDGKKPKRVNTTMLSVNYHTDCLLYTSPSPRDRTRSRMPSSA